MIDDVLCKDSPSQPFFMRLERAEQVPHRGAYRVKFMQGRWGEYFFRPAHIASARRPRPGSGRAICQGAMGHDSSGFIML